MSRFPASTYDAPSEAYPAPQRLPVGCSGFPVPASGEPVTVRWSGDTSLPAAHIWLRVTVATDVREIVRLSVTSATSGTPLGELDLRYSHVFQVHEIPLAAEAAKLAFAEGITLRRIEGANPLWLFWNGPGAEAFHPHLFTASALTGNESAALARVASLDSLQPFGWLEGCVMDGLLALHRTHPGDPRFADALRAHIAQFTQPGQPLAYENPRNIPTDGAIYGEEGPLPLAIAALFAPDSPWLDIAETYFAHWTLKLQGDTPTKERNVGETSYTCAYPLAALATVRPGRGWDRFAARHLLDQHDVLADSGGLWLRRSRDDSFTEYRNWARAHSWYLLGLARTLPLIAHLPESSELMAEFSRACAWTLAQQRPDGLWSVFVDLPALTADTSGTAGIATAFAIGARHGWLGKEFADAALRTRHALRDYITPDGFLRGVSQGNKGGDALQRGTLRVMPQFGLGLYAQLIAETGDVKY